jgi:hypothetical protein
MGHAVRFLHTSETGQPINSILSGAQNSASAEFARRWERMYVLQIGRFVGRVLKKLCDEGQRQGMTIPFIGDFFEVFMCDDVFFRKRKVWSTYRRLVASEDGAAGSIERSGDFTPGRRLVRLCAIGRTSRPIALARWEPPRGDPVSNRRGLVTSRVKAAPFPGLFAPADRRLWPAGAGAAAGATARPPSRRRERPLGAALNPYRKFSQEPRCSHGVATV